MTTADVLLTEALSLLDDALADDHLASRTYRAIGLAEQKVRAALALTTEGDRDRDASITTAADGMRPAVRLLLDARAFRSDKEAHDVARGLAAFAVDALAADASGA